MREEGERWKEGRRVERNLKEKREVEQSDGGRGRREWMKGRRVESSLRRNEEVEKSDGYGLQLDVDLLVRYGENICSAVFSICDPSQLESKQKIYVLIILYFSTNTKQ